MKSVLISIQPYYVFLIIARLMGWNIPQEKTIEVRKDFPKDTAWNKRALIYCSKNKRSFKRIPTEYQLLMSKFLGKIIGEFVCDKIMRFTKYVGWLSDIQNYDISHDHLKETCLEGLWQYGKGKPLYGWHISDLKIYDKPKELGEFYRPVKYNADGPICGTEKEMQDIIEWDCETVFNKESTECTLKDCPRLQELYRVTAPPQSFCYADEKAL